MNIHNVHIPFSSRKKPAKIRMIFYTMKRGTGNTNIFKILKPASQRGGRDNMVLNRVRRQLRPYF